MSKTFHFILGILSLLLGLVGVVLPLLPTTPFVLVAIYAFDRSSPRFHRYCMEIPGVKNGVENWKKYGIISRRSKIQALFLIIFSMGVILIKPGLPLGLRIFTFSVLSAVSIFILSRPSRPHCLQRKVLDKPKESVPLS